MKADKARDTAEKLILIDNNGKRSGIAFDLFYNDTVFDRENFLKRLRGRDVSWIFNSHKIL